MTNSKPDKMLYAKNLLCRKYTTPNRPHVHFIWELVVFEKGETDNIVNGIKFDAKPGDVFLLGPMHTHEIVFRSTSHRHRDFYYFDEEVKSVCELLPGDLYAKACSDTDILTFHLPSATMQSVLRQADDIDALSLISQNEQKIDFALLKKLNLGLLHYVLSVYETKKLINAPAYPKWLLDILQYLNDSDNFTKPVSEIVSSSYYSHAAVSGAFKKHLGMTIVEYVIDRRLDYAAELLSNTSMTALEICSKTGYDSFSYFIKQFKKKFGVTPHKYRKNNEKK